jgi:putative heme-binding domain-containing protein
MRAIKVCTSVLAGFLAINMPSAKQQSGALSEVGKGRQLFIDNCALCHGPDGDSVPGVDLGHGKFKRASSYDNLFEVIRDGVPGTAMPEFSQYLEDLDMHTIVAYLRFMAATAYSTSAPGDPVRGKGIFEGKGECLKCHRVKDKGSRLGPDLGEIGMVRRMIELERSLLEPNAEILLQNRMVRVVTRDGITIIGRLLNQDTFSVQLIDSNERLHSLEKSSLNEYAFIDKSPMPTYRDKLNPKELSDLVSYLVSLKGVTGQ